MTRKTSASIQQQYIRDVSVDCVMFGFHDYHLKVLLLQWPGESGWSLPRGPVLRNEPITDAAIRMLHTTTGLDDVFVQQFQTFSRPAESVQQETAAPSSRDSNPHRAPSLITVGFYALVDFDRVKPKVEGNFQWCEITEMPDLLFDHHEVVESALLALRKDLRYLPIAKLLPGKFTLRDMQKLYETILNRTFDRRNFHKLLMSYDFLSKLPEKKTGSQNKSPHLYTIDFEKYESALQDGISY
ncbi:NUDIX hydrolase [Chryseolinea sp. T2]|uniref:NUDIX hydrolase n=1 Tax=Chryseolinea sp. T2 TaxID=3129255 RepID=UPI0030786ABD